jgi:hypothetical protein
MTGTHDAADLTNSLVDWARGVCPKAEVVVAPLLEAPDTKAGSSPDNAILVRLARVEGTTGPRSGDAVSNRLQLDYRFEVAFADPVAGHQALADLAFALLERDDLDRSSDVVHGDNGSLSASFILHRRRELPRAKRVRETRLQLVPQAQVTGFVRAENGFPLARAHLQVRDSDRLIVTGNDGGFALSAPDGTTVHATVTAKGRSADVELKPGDPNIITLAMES